MTAVGHSVDSDWDRQVQEQGIAEDFGHECAFGYGRKRVRRQETYRPNGEDGERKRQLQATQSTLTGIVASGVEGRWPVE